MAIPEDVAGKEVSKWMDTEWRTEESMTAEGPVLRACTDTLQFTVFGVPQPQGSTRAFIPKGWNRAVITSDNVKVKPWRQEIAATALAEMDKRGMPPFTAKQALCLNAVFYFEPPKSVKKGQLQKTTRPDADKLLRAVCDALTGIVFADDSQIAVCSIAKQYGSPARVALMIRSIGFGESL